MAPTKNVGVKHGNDESAAMAEPTRPFRLLDLPPELQLIIFELAVVHNEPIQVKSRTLGLQPPLSKTCKAVRYDVLEMYYGRNTFEAELEYTLFDNACAWLAAIGAANRRQLKEFFFYDATEPWRLRSFWGGMLRTPELKREVAEFGGRATRVTVEKGDRFRVHFE